MNTPLLQLPSTEFGPVPVPKDNVETLYSGTKVGNTSLVHMVSMIAAIDAIAMKKKKKFSDLSDLMETTFQ